MITTGFDFNFFCNINWCVCGKKLCFMKDKGVSWNLEIEDWQEFWDSFFRKSNYFVVYYCHVRDFIVSCYGLVEMLDCQQMFEWKEDELFRLLKFDLKAPVL